MANPFDEVTPLPQPAPGETARPQAKATATANPFDDVTPKPQAAPAAKATVNPFDEVTPKPKADPTDPPIVAPPLPLPQYDPIITKYAHGNKQLEQLARNVLGIETSGGRNVKKSAAGAIGVMQVEPDTAKPYGVTAEQLADPDTNIRIAMAELQKNLTLFKNDPVRAAQAYNMGAAGLKAALASGKPLPEETERYAEQFRLAPSPSPEPAPTAAPAQGTPKPTAQPSASPTPVGGQPGGHLSGSKDDFLGGVRKGIGTTVGWALNAQHDALMEKAFGGGSPDENRARLRKVLGFDDYADRDEVPGESVFQKWYNHVAAGTTDVVLDTVTDPLTYETLGAGPVLRGAKAAPLIGEAITPAIEAAEGAIGAVKGKVGEAVGALGKRITDTPLGQIIYDNLNYGGAVARDRGMAQVDELRGISNRAGATGSALINQLRESSDAVIKQLSNDSKVRVAQALNGEIKPETLTASERGAFTALRRLTEIDHRVRRSAAIETSFRGLTQGLSDADKVTLKRALETGKAPTSPTLASRYHALNAAVESAIPYRKDYMPAVHEGEDTASREERKVGPSEHYDPRARRREDIKIQSPEQLKVGFDAMAMNSGYQLRTKLVHKFLGDLMDDPKIHDLMSTVLPATGDARSAVQKVGDGILTIIGYPRAATVSLTPRHGANILDLASNTVPPQHQAQFLSNVAVLTKQLMTANAAKYAALTRTGRELGAVSANFREREAFFQKIPAWFPVLGGKGLGPLSKLTDFNNKLVWAIDTAAKQEYAKILVQTGEAQGMRAGGLAGKRLVDYEHVSPLVKAMRYVAPFGSFRAQIPGAVLGGIVRNPARAAAMNRITGGTMYGEKPKGHGVTDYSPTADVSRGLDDPAGYIRGTLGAPVKALLTVGVGEPFAGAPGQSFRDMATELADAPGQIARGQFNKIGTPRKPSKYAETVKLHLARYLNYGNAIDLRFIADMAASGVPEAAEALNEVGAGQFRQPQGSPLERLGREALMQTTGVGIR